MTLPFSSPSFASILTDPALSSSSLYDGLLRNLPSNHNATTTTTCPSASSPFLDALKDPHPLFNASSNLHLTENAGLTHISTLHPLLDLFHSLSSPLGPFISSLLDHAWDASSLDTLRIIFHARSIPNGKGDREAFYTAMGWLYEKSPATLLGNLEELVQPKSRRVLKVKTGEKGNEDEDYEMVDEKGEEATLNNGGQEGNKGGGGELDPANARSHGYYCDLPNLLLLANHSALASRPSAALNIASVLSPPRAKKSRKEPRRASKQRKLRQWKDERSLKESDPKKLEAIKKERAKKHESEQELVQVKAANEREKKKVEGRKRVEKLYKEDPSYRLLHIRVAQIFANQLRHDLALLQSSSSCPVSLAAKWLPSPGSTLALQTLLPDSVAILLFPSLPPTTTPSYLLSALQKTYLSPLRAAAQIPERPLSAKTYDQVHYARVPSLAMKRYKGLFLEKDGKRFGQFLVDVKAGKRSISGAALTPASLVAEARSLSKRDREGGIGEVLGAQWEALVESVRETGTMGEAMAVADVSGSMSGRRFRDGTSPMDSSIGLALLLSQIAPEPFKGTFLTFSGQPEIIEIDTKGSFVDIVHQMERANWGGNTDFIATFRLILHKSLAAGLKPEQMIKRLYVFSDMEFDQAGSYEETHFEMIKREFEGDGYQLPELVFWNLNGTTSKPVTAESANVALVSGYSAALLKVFLEGGNYDDPSAFIEIDEDGTAVKQPRAGGLDPVDVMKKALGHESFAGLRVVE